jgi:hypothetical protein
MEDAKKIALRRTLQPHAGYLVICFIVSLIWVLAIYKTGDLGGIGVIALLWSVLLVSQYPNTRYRIFWNKDEIEQISAYKDVTIIKISDIERIARESSDIRTMRSLTRPPSRITIYGKNKERPQWIDVSLKHFSAEDIRRLMRAIHEKRPDLSIPKQWL